MAKEKFKWIEEVLKEAIKNSKYLYNKEDGFKIAVFNALNSKPCDFVLSEKENGSESIDIYYYNRKAAIELKYRTNKDNEEYKGFNYKITNCIKFYEYLEDMNKVNRIINNNKADEAYAVMLTNIRKDNLKQTKEYIEFYEKNIDNINGYEGTYDGKEYKLDKKIKEEEYEIIEIEQLLDNNTIFKDFYLIIYKANK